MDKHRWVFYPIGAFFGKQMDRISPTRIAQGSEGYYEDEFGFSKSNELSAQNEDHYYEEFGIPEFHNNDQLRDQSSGYSAETLHESFNEPNDPESIHINIDGSLMLNGIHGTDIHGHLFGESDKFGMDDFSASSFSDDSI